MIGEHPEHPDGAPWGIYTRISYVQRTDGTIDTLGVERQRPGCEDLIRRKGGRVAEVYVDNDRSAYKGDRPAFERMLADARAGKIRGIAVWDVDRLSRDPDRDNARVIELAERYGVQLGTVTGEIDLSTSIGRMLFRMLGALARRESEHRSERIRLKNDQRAERGEPVPTGKRPFGYAEGGMEVIEAEAALIREAARRLLDDGATVGELLRDWHARGVTGVTGVPLSTTTIRRVLVSPRTAGLREHRGRIVGRAAWPAILDEPTRERLIRLFSAPDRKRQGPTRRYLLTGLVYCGRDDCGQPMVGASGGRGRPCYQCKSGGNRPGSRGCGRTSVTAPALEQVLLEAVIARVCSPAFDEVIARQLAAAAEADDTPARLAADRRELEELAAAYGQGACTLAEWLAARAGIQARIREAEARLAQRPSLKAVLELPRGEEAFRRAWETWTLPERRRALRAVLVRVVIKPVGKGHKWLNIDRVEPHWVA